MKKFREKFFYIDTLYGLFICLLLENDLNKNFYFFSTKLPKKILDNLENKMVIKERNNIKLVKYVTGAVYFRILKLLFFKRIKDSKFYIHDLGKYSQYFFNNYTGKFIVVEDGTMNYSYDALKGEKEKANKYLTFSKKLRKRFVYGIKKFYPTLGQSEKVEKIILTGILPIPEVIKSKVEIINIEEKWNSLTKEKQREILSIFNIEIEDFEVLKNSVNKFLLLTQPLSEDGIMSEEEKISIYKNILQERNIKEVYIKIHPRERTNYIKELQNIKVHIIKKDFPVEILFLLNINFSKVITLFSTAALNFKGKGEIEFIGTKNYPKLLERFGVIEDRKLRRIYNEGKI